MTQPLLRIEEARALAARVPGWEGAADLRIRPLTGGLTNQSFYLEVDGEPFVLRISGSNTQPLCIDREAELAAFTAAGEAGLAPQVVCFLRPEGHLIYRFEAGQVWSKQDLLRPEIMSRAVQTLRQVHQLPPIAFEFCPLRDIRRRLRTAAELGIERPEDTQELVERAAELERRFWRCPSSDTGLCHTDPFAGNFIATEEVVKLIDWEYAGMGDVYYDLASVSLVLPAPERAQVLEMYLGHVMQEALGKLSAMTYLMRLWNWTWALLQVRYAGEAGDEPGDESAEHMRIEQALLAGLRAHRAQMA